MCQIAIRRPAIGHLMGMNIKSDAKGSSSTVSLVVPGGHAEELGVKVKWVIFKIGSKNVLGWGYQSGHFELKGGGSLACVAACAERGSGEFSRLR